jgi:hypothetical protein
MGSSLPLPSYLLASLSGYHPRLSLFSFSRPSLFIFKSLQLIPSPQLYPKAPPLSTLLPCYCSIFLVALKINPSILHILFFLSFAPLIVVGANGVVFFLSSQNSPKLQHELIITLHSQIKRTKPL